MPLYTAITEDGFVSDDVKEMIAKEITRIHTTIMKVPATATPAEREVQPSTALP